MIRKIFNQRPKLHICMIRCKLTVHQVREVSLLRWICRKLFIKLVCTTCAFFLKKSDFFNSILILLHDYFCRLPLNDIQKEIYTFFRIHILAINRTLSSMNNRREPIFDNILHSTA